jgi:hypothetical protein
VDGPVRALGEGGCDSEAHTRCWGELVNEQDRRCLNRMNGRLSSCLVNSRVCFKITGRNPFVYGAVTQNEWVLSIAVVATSRKGVVLSSSHIFERIRVQKDRNMIGSSKQVRKNLYSSARSSCHVRHV